MTKKLIETAAKVSQSVANGASYVATKATDVASTTGAYAQAAAGKAGETATYLGKVVSESAVYLTDLNNDGKVDQEDMKIALEKAGYYWDNFDIDAKKAIGAGMLAYVGSSTIPLVGSAINGPSFVGVTIYTYITLKAQKLQKG